MQQMRSRLRSQYHSIPGCVFFPGFLLAFVRKWKRHFVNYMYWTSETWYSIFWLRHACMLTCGVYAKGNNVLIKQEVKIFFLCLQSGWVNWVLLSRQENKQEQTPIFAFSICITKAALDARFILKHFEPLPTVLTRCTLFGQYIHFDFNHGGTRNNKGWNKMKT